MDNFLRKSKLDIEQQKEDRYVIFNFEQNPFPKDPSVVIGSPDKRNNGSIYLPDIRKDEEKKFEKLLIPKPKDAETNIISFLMDYATRQGRGIGKTAFLNHQCQRIMNDLGANLTDNNYVIFAVYILPIPGENYRNFWKISKLIIKELINQDIISIAMCRMRAFTETIPNNILDEVNGKPLETIGNDKWLESKKVNVFQINNVVQDKLIELGLNSELSKSLAHHGCVKSSFINYFFSQIPDTYWRKNENKLLFDDLVKLFKYVGFSKGIILFDELEKIFPHLNKLERKVFTEAIRYYFIDGKNENTKHSFFELLLTIHPYLQELMMPHWMSAGLERFAALGGDQSEHYTIYFNPIPETFAIPLAKAYLIESHITSDNKKTGELFPFDEKTLIEAIKISNFIPGKFLTLLHIVIEKAIEKGWKTINIKEIEKVYKSEIPVEPDVEDSDEPLPPPLVELK